MAGAPLMAGKLGTVFRGTGLLRMSCTAAGSQLTPFSKFLDSTLSWQEVASSSPFSIEFVFSASLTLVYMM